MIYKTELLKIAQEMLDTLEKIANSRKWNSLRYWLREMWLN